MKRFILFLNLFLVFAGTLTAQTVTTIDALNEATQKISVMEHALTSKKESGVRVKQKAEELGAVLDKSAKIYKPKEAE